MSKARKSLVSAATLYWPSHRERGYREAGSARVRLAMGAAAGVNPALILARARI